MLWSILVPTVPARRAFLAKLMAELDRQVAPYNDVEVLVLEDNRKREYGPKLQALIDIAQGTYVNFVDDDDRVAPNYVERIRGAMAHRTDCVGFRGEVSTNGVVNGIVEYSCHYRVWVDEPGRYCRPPQHITPIKRELVKQVPWTGHYGADRTWSQAMIDRGLIQSEVFVPEVLYFYDYSDASREGVWR